jgi:hypothetical protein
VKKASRFRHNIANRKAGFSIQYKAVNEVTSMPILLKSFILVCAFFAVFAFSSLAQLTNTPASDTNVVTATATQAGQAPDEVTRRISVNMRFGLIMPTRPTFAGLRRCCPGSLPLPVRGLSRAPACVGRLAFYPVRPSSHFLADVFCRYEGRIFFAASSFSQVVNPALTTSFART